MGRHMRDDKRFVASRRAPTADHVWMTESIRPFAPAYFTFADGPWLQSLLDERARFVGQRRALWRARTQQPLPVPAPPAKLRIALDVLDRLTRDRCPQPIAPRQVRTALFRAAVDHDKQAAIAIAADQLRLTPEAVLEAMFADLPDERVLMPLSAALDVTQYALSCNELMVQRCLQLALRARIVVDGNVRAVVRHVKWTGLLCVVRGNTADERAVLEVSGPYALFRHTRLYGRALASLLPRLARCHSFRFEADCVVRGQRELARLTIRSGDPISPARELPQFDSRLEERFAREFSRLAPEWDVVREPRPIVTGTSLFFPDFELRRRTTGECYWLEIVGFWTQAYLAKKLEQLEQAGLERLILCVDEARGCATERVEALGHVVWYKRRIDVRQVIGIVDPALGRPSDERSGVSRPQRRKAGDHRVALRTGCGRAETADRSPHDAGCARQGDRLESGACGEDGGRRPAGEHRVARPRLGGARGEAAPEGGVINCTARGAWPPREPVAGLGLPTRFQDPQPRSPSGAAREPVRNSSTRRAISACCDQLATLLRPRHARSDGYTFVRSRGPLRAALGCSGRRIPRARISLSSLDRGTTTFRHRLRRPRHRRPRCLHRVGVRGTEALSADCTNDMGA